jgi:hypothetical protein
MIFLGKDVLKRSDDFQNLFIKCLKKKKFPLLTGFGNLEKFMKNAKRSIVILDILGHIRLTNFTLEFGNLQKIFKMAKAL